MLPNDAVGVAGDLAGPTDFLERLGWYREMLDGTLAASVPTLEPQRHLYALVKDFLERAGKGLRPALCIATTRALGGRAEDALLSAAGIEMLHNAFLVHDDIEDGSESRRGVATMHRRAGVPIAVNTGDAMNALAMRLFRRNVEAWARRWRCASSTKSITCSSNVWRGRPSSWDGFGTMISRSGRKIICGSC